MHLRRFNLAGALTIMALASQGANADGAAAAEHRLIGV